MYDIQKLKQLREETGVSFSLCKKALEEGKNNIAEAKKLLKKWGQDKAKNKKGKTTSEGGIFIYSHHNKKIGAMVELLCETDFVSFNKEFQNLGNEIAMQIASLNPETVDELLKQDYIRNQGKKISDLIQEAILKFGENIKINRFVRFEI